MGEYISILILSCGFVAAVAVLLTAEPKISRYLTAAAGAAALVGGLLIYGSGYIAVSGSLPEALLHTVFAVCRMFLGDSDFGDISEAPLFGNQWALTLCWCLHVLAFYATSSTAISLIGANALRKLRLRLSANRDLNIIYGVNEDSVSFGQELTGQLRELTVYVSEDADSPLADAIMESGGVLRGDPRAVRGDTAFLRSLGIHRGRRNVTVYALHKDYLKNTAYATALLEAFRVLDVGPERISLVLHGREDAAAKALQVGQDRYGYGFVTVYRENALAARLLTRRYPPGNCVSFDEYCAAREDFEALVIGFGNLGQAVLRSLIMNGQFVGSSFRADVFAPDLEARDGFFRNSYPGILDHYNICFHPYDGRSRQLYSHLLERLDRIRYIAVCTGTEEGNEEIAEELREFIGNCGRDIPVYQCSRRGIKTTDWASGETRECAIYHPDILATRQLDRMAMTVNQYYQGAYSRGALADWLACDYFSRTSNRAYADFLETVLRATGRTEADALAGRWDFTPEQLENLGRMEHARWNAFHFCMGYMPMSEEEYIRRTEIYRQEQVQTGKGKIRIGKNPARKTHACLIPWEALDGLSARENAITGGRVDYKQMDINNIMLLPQLYRIRDGHTGGDC